MFRLPSLPHGIDYPIGIIAASSPKWLEWLHQFNELLAFLAGIGGLILLGYRLRIAAHEWAEKKRARRSQRA